MHSVRDVLDRLAYPQGLRLLGGPGGCTRHLQIINTVMEPDETRIEAFKCPLCTEASVYHVQQDKTACYTCEACAFVAFEYWGDKDLIALGEYLNRPIN